MENTDYFGQIKQFLVVGVNIQFHNYDVFRKVGYYGNCYGHGYCDFDLAGN